METSFKCVLDCNKNDINLNVIVSTWLGPSQCLNRGRYHLSSNNIMASCKHSFFMSSEIFQKHCWMLQFSREKLFLLHAEICATFWYQLRHFPWPGPTSCSSLHPLIRNETPSSDLVHYSRLSYHGALIKALYFPTFWPLCAASSLSAHCMEIEDFKILILFLAMMNLIGDIWVYQLVNDQLTKKTNTMDDDFIYQRKLGTGRWAEVIMMTVNDKTFSSELIVFRQNKKIEFMQR